MTNWKDTVLGSVAIIVVGTVLCFLITQLVSCDKTWTIEKERTKQQAIKIAEDSETNAIILPSRP